MSGQNLTFLYTLVLCGQFYFVIHYQAFFSRSCTEKHFQSCSNKAVERLWVDAPDRLSNVAHRRILLSLYVNRALVDRRELKQNKLWKWFAKIAVKKGKGVVKRQQLFSIGEFFKVYSILQMSLFAVKTGFLQWDKKELLIFLVSNTKRWVENAKNTLHCRFSLLKIEIGLGETRIVYNYVNSLGLYEPEKGQKSSRSYFDIVILL